MTTVVKWSALGSESANIAGTALDSKADGTTTFIADIDNTTNKDLYVQFWLALASVNPTTNKSVTLQLRRKRASTYADNASESLMITVNAGASAKNIDFVMRLPSAGIYGLFWTNGMGVASVASGNALYSQTWNEEGN
jgi:hypothetical protein